MTTHRIPHAPTAVLLTAALALPAAALAQDEPQPVTTDAAPLEATVKAPASVTRVKLKQGFAVTATCTSTCSSRVELIGPIGIITQKTVPGGTGTVKLKATAAQVKALKRGAKLTVQLTVRPPDAGPSDGSLVKQATVKLR